MIPDNKLTESDLPRGIGVETTAVVFAMKHWKLLTLLGFLIATAGYGWYQSSVIKGLRFEVMKLNVDSDFHKNETISCKKQFSDLSRAIKEASDRSKDNQTQMDNLRDEISVIDDATDIRIITILDKPVPVSCTEAMNFLRENRRVR